MISRLNQLHSERSDLKMQGRIGEMIPIQLEIIAETERIGRVSDLANAWNYLSGLHQHLCEYDKAERAARNALDVYVDEPTPSAEVLGCYQFNLAQILAAQHRFAEAVPIAEAGVRNYSIFHNPPDEFLKVRQEEAARMRKCMERETDIAD